MTHGGLLERKLKCNEINLSAKTQTEIQTFFVVFFFFLPEKACLVQFFFLYTSYLHLFFCEFK